MSDPTLTQRLVDLVGARQELPPGAEVHFEWGWVPQGNAGLLFVAALAALAGLVVWVYRREGAASAGRKAFLAALRLLALALAALTLMEPRLAIDLQRVVRGQVIVLWDTSLSLSITDRYREPALREEVARAAGVAEEHLEALTRQEVAWRIVSRKEARLLPQLAEKNELLLFAFDQEPRRLAEVPAPAPGRELEVPEALAPRGPATDLALALRRALEETGGRRVAAVVAITDGRVNKGEGGGQALAQDLARRGIPLYAVGIGDPTPPQNVEVVQISAEARAVLGDPLVVEGTLRARGYEGQQVEVELRQRKRAGSGETGPPETIERRPLVLPADGQPLPLSFRFTPAEKGELLLELVIEPRPEETVTDDNLRSTLVTISDDKARVLLVSGSPGFEYHFLKTRLIREKTALVSCWLQSADPRFPQDGNERIDALPLTLEELRPFDVVILLDPNPEAWDDRSAQTLKQWAAETRGGLLFVPGPKYGPLFLQQPDLQAMRDLLPVVAGEQPGGEAIEVWPLEATVEGADHPAARLSPDADRTRSMWSRLPGFFFSYPVARLKSGATVLVRHLDPAGGAGQGGEGPGRPLLAVQYFEGAPVAWLGSSETWRWRSTAPRIHDRFWVNLLRFLLQGRLGGGRKRVELLPDKESYVMGEPVRLRVHAYDRAFRPLEAASLTARADLRGDQHPIELAPTGQPGWFQGTFLPSSAGALSLSLPLPDDDPGARPESVTVEVKLPDVEFQDPRLDRELLGEVARITSGALLRPTEVVNLAGRIPSLEEKLVVAGAPIPLWDRWGTVAALVGLLGLEWFIRKRSRMV